MMAGTVWLPCRRACTEVYSNASGVLNPRHSDACMHADERKEKKGVVWYGMPVTRHVEWACRMTTIGRSKDDGLRAGGDAVYM